MSTLLTMVYYKKDRTYRIRIKDATGTELEHKRVFKTIDGAKTFMRRLEGELSRQIGSDRPWQDVPLRKN